MWISRSCWPRIAYGVSALQSIVQKPLVRDLVLANKIVRIVKEEPDYGLTFKSVVNWPSPGNPDVRFCIVTVSDASHGNEDIYLDDWHEQEPCRSQEAKAILLANQDMVNGQSGHFHLVSYGSTVQKRVVNSIIKAETYGLTDAQEAGDLIRAAIADMHEQLDPKFT